MGTCTGDQSTHCYAEDENKKALKSLLVFGIFIILTA